MLVLVKCIFWLGVVFLAIGGRGVEPPDHEPSARVSVTKAREREPAQAKSQSAPARRGDGISDVADQAAAKLAGAARDQCLARPLDCLLAAERLGLGPAKAEPARR